MPIDASIPLSLKEYKPYDPLETTAKAYALKSMVDQDKERQQAAQERQQLKDVYGKADLSSPEGQQQTLKDVGAISPEARMSLQKSVTDQQKSQSEIEKNKSITQKNAMDRSMKLLDVGGRAAGAALDAYETAKQNNVSDPIALAKAQAINTAGIIEAHDSGIINDDQFKQMMSQPFDPQKAKAFVSMSESAKAQLEQKMKQQSMQLQEKRENAREKEAALRDERQNRMLGIMERRLSNSENKPSGDKLPVGYRWKDAEHTTMEPIPGGPKTGMGSREGVYFQRMQQAGNEAAAALKNITELPTTVSTGLFGGRKQGPGLLSATKEVLTNTLTSEEVKDYQTVIAGVNRNLASIEASGLAPSGSLTHAMDAITFKEGDTQFNKMRKLAEIRQIVEKGLEPYLHNPKVQPEEKEFINILNERLRDAVPFTNSDVTRLEREQRKNPDATMSDFIKSTGVSKDSSGPKKISTKAEMDALPSGTEFVAPDGSIRRKK